MFNSFLLFNWSEDLSSILNLDTQLLVSLLLQWSQTAIVIAILSYLLYKPVLKFMAQRKERIRLDLENAEKTSEEANLLKKQYHAKMTDIEAERGTILEEARKTAQEKEKQIIAEAKNEAALIISRAKTEMEREKEKSKDEMKKQIIEISSLMASRFVSQNMDQQTQNKLLAQVVADLGDGAWLN